MKNNKPFKLDRPDDYVPFSDPRWNQQITVVETNQPTGPITKEQEKWVEEELKWFKKYYLKDENAEFIEIK